MEKKKIIRNKNLEACRELPDGRMEILTGKVVRNRKRSFVLKLCKRMILSPGKEVYDLMEVTSSQVQLFWTQLKDVNLLKSPPDLATEGWDDGGY